MRIVITGGLGYLGTELCKSLDPILDEIIVVDNKFIASRVVDITEDSIQFYERDVLNIKDIISSADVVYHLAGITDVAYTSTESNPEKDELIKKVGIEGTRYIINNVPSSCKIIFPSTHVIFEGLTQETFDIAEDHETAPVLAYAVSKRQSEIDLFDSNANFVIVRLSSVYGYNESIRIKIVANLFAKMASRNQKIKLFGGGHNYKPLVGVADVAHAMKRLAGRDYNREVFNIVNENLTVREIAEICKRCNPELEIESTSDEVPNRGYTLSNKKLLSTGFWFAQNVEEEIEYMVSLWKNKRTYDV